MGYVAQGVSVLLDTGYKVGEVLDTGSGVGEVLYTGFKVVDESDTAWAVGEEMDAGSEVVDDLGVGWCLISTAIVKMQRSRDNRFLSVGMIVLLLFPNVSISTYVEVCTICHHFKDVIVKVFSFHLFTTFQVLYH